MKAKDLKIGNLVYDTKGQVNTIDMEALIYIDSESSSHQVTPIPLTKERLIEFDWNKCSKLNHVLEYEKDNYYIQFNKRFDTWTLFKAFSDNTVTPSKTKYCPLMVIDKVHVLQNVWSVLNCEELIKSDA